MDFQFWLIVIITVISLLSRLGKKKAESTVGKPADSQRKHPNRPVPSERPKEMTFEELLREITEAKQKPVTYAPPVLQPATPSRTPEVIDYDEDLAEEEQDLETIEEDTYSQEETRRKRVNAEYEEAKRQAFSRASLEETMSISDTQMQFGKFKAFELEQKKDLLNEYTKDLRNREGLKKAFVLTEILNRKF